MPRAPNAPEMRAASFPPLKRIIVGIERMPKRPATFGAASVSSLAKRTRVHGCGEGAVVDRDRLAFEERRFAFAADRAFADALGGDAVQGGATRAPNQHQSIRAPEIFTTRAILSKSARRRLAKPSGVIACGTTPCLSRRSRITGSFSSLPTAALIASTVARGMPAGPSSPIHESNA